MMTVAKGPSSIMRAASFWTVASWWSELKHLQTTRFSKTSCAQQKVGGHRRPAAQRRAQVKKRSYGASDAEALGDGLDLLRPEAALGVDDGNLAAAAACPGTGMSTALYRTSCRRGRHPSGNNGSSRLTHVLGKHGGDGEGVHPLGLACAVLAVDFREAGGLDAAAEERVEVLAAGRDLDLLASGAGERNKMK